MEIGHPLAGFSRLSDELIIHVLHCCYFKHILRLAATSKRNHNIVTNSISLQLHIELESNELEITGVWPRESTVTYSQVLAELLRYQTAWRNLDFTGPIERIPKQKPITCQFREGNYVVGSRSKPGSSANQGFDLLQIIPLAPLEPPNPVFLRDNFQELTVDVRQDLAVLGKWHPQLSSQGTAQLEIALVSLRTGLPHPLALISAFHIRVDFDYDPSTIDLNLDVMHDMLTVEIQVDNAVEEKFEVMIWNWRSGGFLARIGSDFGTASSSYFDGVHLGLLLSDLGADQDCHARRITLSLYRIPSHAYQQAPPDNCFCASSYPCALPIVTFLFPEVDDCYQLLSNSLQLDPVPGQTLPFDNAPLAHSTAVTYTIDLRLHPKWGNGDCVDLRIFLSARHLRRYLPQRVTDGQTALVPWDVWGAAATRWFLWNNPNSYGIEWALWTYGSRFVLVDTNPDSMLHDLSVIDFAPRTAKEDPGISLTLHQTPEYKREMEHIISEGLLSPYLKHAFQGKELPPVFTDTVESNTPTVIKKGFLKSVESRLPYRIVTKARFLPTCEDWSIDGNHIIGLYPADRDDGTILVYRLQYNSDSEIAQGVGWKSSDKGPDSELSTT